MTSNKIQPIDYWAPIICSQVVASNADSIIDSVFSSLWLILALAVIWARRAQVKEGEE